MNESIFRPYIENFYNQYFKGFSEEEKIVKYAVEMAYSDTKRVLHGIGSESNKKKKEEALEKITEKIQNNFLIAGVVDSFDTLHDELCNIWVNELGTDTPLGRYGKAQKIINMTFKYLYTYYYNIEDSDILNKFKDCHFTLDSYTLRWLNGCKNVKNKPRCLNSETTWSKLNRMEYIEIQKYASECVKELFQETPMIEAEYLIWAGVNLYGILIASVNIKNQFPDTKALDRVIQYMKQDEKTSLFKAIDLLKCDN